MDLLNKKVDFLTRTNNNLKELLLNKYIDEIKKREEDMKNDFIIKGFTDLVALNQGELKQPQLVMNAFCNETLKINNSLEISKGNLIKINSRDKSQHNYHLQGTLNNNQDRKLIYANI